MASDEIAALNAELEAARRRISDLEARVEADLAAKAAPSWLYATLDMADVGVWDWDITLDRVHWTDAVYRSYGHTRESFNGTLQAVVEATLEEDRAHLGQNIEYTMKTGKPYCVEYRVRRPDGTIRWISARGQATHDGSGKPIRLSGTAIDVTERKREEDEQNEMHQRVVHAQREALRALGTPVIPLAQKTLVSPLIGVLDDDRIAQLTEVLLGAVTDASAEVVLLDITGVPHLDMAAAEGLIRTGHAVRLLGAELVLTGVRPQVAKILVELDVDLATFVIKANLQSGIEYSMSLRRRGAR